MKVEKLEVGKDVLVDDEMEEELLVLNKEIDKLYVTPIGYTKVVLEGSETARVQETRFGNFMADLVKCIANSEVTIINSGQIRASKDIPVGFLTIGHIMELIHYNPKIFTLKGTGA